nr:hypothetical protein Iba_chr11bCG6200 [Ipomoea batatas]
MLSTTNGNLPLSRTLPNPQPETTASEANPQPESTVSEANPVEDQDHIERSTKKSKTMQSNQCGFPDGDAMEGVEQQNSETNSGESVRKATYKDLLTGTQQKHPMVEDLVSDDAIIVEPPEFWDGIEDYNHIEEAGFGMEYRDHIEEALLWRRPRRCGLEPSPTRMIIDLGLEAAVDDGVGGLHVLRQGSDVDIGILDMAPSLASVSSSFSNLETTEQDSGPTCKTLCILSPYALLK